MPTETAHQSIAYEDVIDLLGIADPESWDSQLGDIYPPYILMLDGIYAKPAFRLVGLSEEELLALRPWFPPGNYGNYSKPVLALPCVPQDFVEFIAGAELWDRVMYPSGEFTEVWRKHGLPEDCDPSATPKVALNMPASETPLPEAGPEPFWFNAQREHSEYTESMRALAQQLHAKLGRNARGREAWTAMVENPPGGFDISVAQDAVEIHGEPPLIKREFIRRWKRWTMAQ